MNFTIAWRNLAKQQLAKVWMDSEDRKAVNRDCKAVDTLLSVDGHLKGEDYYGDRYVFLPTVWALYRVDLENRIVTILQVGRPGKDLPHDDIE